MRRLTILRALLHDTHGAEIAEAAAVLPLMFMMLLGIFWFGQAFSIYGTITRAAQEGARAGALPYCVTCAGGNNTLAQYAINAVNAVNNTLTASNLNPGLTQQPPTPPVFTSCTNTAPTCNASASTNVCVQMPVQLTIPASGADGVCGISVTFQYPFQFWLPFTTLNKQQIWMTASARVRMEAH